MTSSIPTTDNSPMMSTDLSVVPPTTSTSTYVPSVITWKGLNEIERSHSQLTPHKFDEHLAFEQSLKSLDYAAVYRGHDNATINKAIHHHVRGLIEAGILPEDCYLGRKPFAGIPQLTRAAINVPVSFVKRQELEIEFWCMERDINSEELIKVLKFAALNGASNGDTYFESITLQKGMKILNALEPAVRTQILTGKSKATNFFKASVN